MTLIDRLIEIENTTNILDEKKFSEKVINIKNYCKKKSHVCYAMHPHFTCHDYRHSEVIIRRLDKLCDDLFNPENILSLNYTEIFCLLASAYLHDTGMIHCRDDDKIRVNELNKRQNETPLTVRDLQRKEHHERSAEYIHGNREKLDLDSHLSRVIGIISKGHRKVDLYDNEFKNETLGDHVIRVRLLAALLRLADELDLSHDRITEELYKIFDAEHGFDFFSKIKFMKHHYTSGITISKEGIGFDKIKIINIYLKIPSKDYERRMKAIIKGPIEREIKATQSFLSEVGLNVKLNEIKCEYDRNMFIVPDILFHQFYQPYRQKMRILIVDDKFEYRTIFKNILKSEGYSIETARDGPEALSKIKSEKYDLILFDIVMENDDKGLEILKKVKDDINGTTVFMVSVRSDAKAALESKMYGAEEYFIKEELNLIEFRTKVNNVFEKKFDLLSLRT